MKKYFLYGLFAILLLFSANVVYALDTSLKVYDDADLLTAQEEQYLKGKIDTFMTAYDMDMAIVTTLSNSFGSADEYAEDFYVSNSFGKNQHHDGIIMLIDRSAGYNDVFIYQDGEAMRIYSEDRIEWILDDIEEVKSKGYASMFEAFIDSASYYASLGVAPEFANSHLDKNGAIVYPRKYPWLWIILISLLTPSIIVGILLGRNKMVKKATKASLYLDKSTVQLTRNQDVFLHTHTTSVHIERHNSSGPSGHSAGTHGGGRRM